MTVYVCWRGYETSAGEPEAAFLDLDAAMSYFPGVRNWRVVKPGWWSGGPTTGWAQAEIRAFELGLA